MNRHDEIQSRRDRREPVHEDGRRGRHHRAIGKQRRIRRIECPARVDASDEQEIDREQSRQDEEIPAREIEAGEGQIARADHQRNEEIAERRRDRGTEEEPYHDDAVHGEEPVVEVRLQQRAGRIDEMQPEQRGRRAADEEKERNRSEIQQRDPLVIMGQKPRADGQLPALDNRARCSAVAPVIGELVL